MNCARKKGNVVSENSETERGEGPFKGGEEAEEAISNITGAITWL